MVEKDYFGFLEVENFNLKYTIESGQFFYYIKNEDGSYYIVERDKIFKLKQKENKIYYKYNKNSSLNDIIYFLNVEKEENINYLDFEKDIESDELLKKSFKKYLGLRILKQDPFQCSIGFICSAASNIEKIRKNIFLISKKFGKKEIFDKKEFYLFPDPKDIDNIEFLKDAKTGFRAKYILEFSNFIAKNSNYFLKIKSKNYEFLLKELMKHKGIGEKIADCILLFSFNQKNAFPIDTWIKKVLIKYYLKDENNKNIDLKYLKNKAKEIFKTNLGLKQQFLYLYAIDNLKREKK